jgi:cytochrome c-type protein NapB
MKKMIIAFIALFMVSVAASAAVNTKACVGCHGKNFEKSAMGKSKIVANMSQEEVSEALLGYKAGTYGGSMKKIMQMQVSKYSEEDLMITGIGKKSFTNKVKAVSKSVLEKTKKVASSAKKKVGKYFEKKVYPTKMVFSEGNKFAYQSDDNCWVVDYSARKSNSVKCEKIESSLGVCKNLCK